MISCYDLYDIYAIFVNIRAYPENPINEKAIFCIIDVINNREENHDFNQIRTAIAPFLTLDNIGTYSFVTTQNVYTYFPYSFLKDEYIYSVLSSACNEMIKVINNQNILQIGDLADCLHNLPILLVENNYKIPRHFWKCEIEPYRKAWNKDFMIKEEMHKR